MSLVRAVTPVIAAAIVGCTEATVVEPFAGHWVGANSDFQAALTLSQSADTVRGGFRLIRRADSYIISSPLFSITLHGDSLTFSFTPDTASGYSTIIFAGQRRGDQIDVQLTTDTLVSTLTLNRP